MNVTGINEHRDKWDFEFDHIFGPTASQVDVFEEISLLVQSALDGYKVAIFAYGQTGSGKTHTMEGPPLHTIRGAEEYQAVAGIIPRTVDRIFLEVAEMQQRGWIFEVRASFLEIYNESCSDLLREREVKVTPRANSRRKRYDANGNRRSFNAKCRNFDAKCRGWTIF